MLAIYKAFLCDSRAYNIYESVGIKIDNPNSQELGNILQQLCMQSLCEKCTNKQRCQAIKEQQPQQYEQVKNNCVDIIYSIAEELSSQDIDELCNKYEDIFFGEQANRFNKN